MKKLVIILGTVLILSIVVFGMRLWRQSAEENSERDLESKAIAETEVKRLDIERLFSPEPIEESFVYEVQPKDTLANIAKRFNTTVDLIVVSNRLQDPNILRVGQKLKIIKGEFKIIVDISDNTLSLFLNDKLVKIYPVGSGKERSTPLGEFKIMNKLINPTWYPPEGGVHPYGHLENILGTRWMGISEPGYGIHGTTQPETIGEYSSRGCIRMYNQDVEELFKIVPLDTKVIIKN